MERYGNLWDSGLAFFPVAAAAAAAATAIGVAAPLGDSTPRDGDRWPLFRPVVVVDDAAVVAGVSAADVVDVAHVAFALAIIITTITTTTTTIPFAAAATLVAAINRAHPAALPAEAPPGKQHAQTARRAAGAVGSEALAAHQLADPAQDARPPNPRRCVAVKRAAE